MWLPGGSSAILVGGRWHIARWLPSTPGWDTSLPKKKSINAIENQKKKKIYIGKYRIFYTLFTHMFCFFWTCDWFLKRPFLRDFWFRRRMNWWYNHPSEMLLPLKAALFEPPNNTHRAREVVLQPFTDCKALECVTRKVGKGCSSVTMQCFDASWCFNFAMDLEISMSILHFSWYPVGMISWDHRKRENKLLS